MRVQRGIALPLGALTAAVIVLAATGVLPHWPGLVHLVGLPPLDLYADMRVLLLSATSVPAFVALLAVVLLVRITVLALLMGGLTRQRLALAAGFYAVLAVPLLLAAEIVYIANALLYARLFWAGVGVVAAAVLLAGPVPWQWPRREGSAVAGAWREGLRVEVLLVYGAAVIGVGALADLVPALTLPLIAVSAVATGAAVHALSRPPSGRPLLRLGAFAVAAALAATVFITTRGIDLPDPAPERAGSIMVMSGINSRSGHGDMFVSRTDMLGYDCDHTFYFSYAGPGDGQPQGLAQCPIRTGTPYVPEDTQRPLDEQVEVFAQQVRDLPRPLVVAGHSHGAWVAWKAVATGAAPEVDVLVLVGPFPESPVGYRPFGESGTGQVASDLLHLFVPLAHVVDFDFHADAPAAERLLGAANGGGELFDEPLPEDVYAVSVTSSADLPLMPSGWRLPTADRNVCPLRTPHPYIPTTPAYYEEVNRFLDGRPGLDCPPWRDWGKPLALPFSIPTDLPTDWRD